MAENSIKLGRNTYKRRASSIKTKNSSPLILSFSFPKQTGEGRKRNIKRTKQSSARAIRQMPSFTS